MKRRLTLLALAFSVVGATATMLEANGPILRIAADFKNFDGTETATAVLDSAGGTAVFTKTVFVPFGMNTLYFTVSTTGDTHDGAALRMSCNVDGVFCNPGFGGAGGAAPGWISLQKHKNYALGLFGDGGGGAGDMHDNSIHYTWCTKIEPGAHTVELRLGSGGPDFETGTGATPPFVFFEAAHFYIDASRIAGNNRCTRAPDPPPPTDAVFSSVQ